jgi:hypothetical protein
MGGRVSKPPHNLNLEGSEWSASCSVIIIPREETGSTKCAIFSGSYAKYWQQCDVFPGNSGTGKPASERDQINRNETGMATQVWLLQEMSDRQRTKCEGNLYC